MADEALLLSRIRELLEEKFPLVVAIDGPCGGGKTTLAARINKAFPDSALIPVDEFFLQPNQRSPERLATPGGNMDRERLEQEVLSQLRKGQPFTYHRYDCQENRLDPVLVKPARLVIVEGSYSLHPELTRHYDLKVFLDVDGDTQMARLKKRVPEALLPRFTGEWIPMEQTYFQAFRVKENSDLVLSL